jgi:hypothetical protein
MITKLDQNRGKLFIRLVDQRPHLLVGVEGVERLDQVGTEHDGVLLETAGLIGDQQPSQMMYRMSIGQAESRIQQFEEGDRFLSVPLQEIGEQEGRNALGQQRLDHFLVGDDPDGLIERVQMLVPEIFQHFVGGAHGGIHRVVLVPPPIAHRCRNFHRIGDALHPGHVRETARGAGIHGGNFRFARIPENTEPVLRPRLDDGVHPVLAIAHLAVLVEHQWRSIKHPLPSGHILGKLPDLVGPEIALGSLIFQKLLGLRRSNFFHHQPVFQFFATDLRLLQIQHVIRRGRHKRVSRGVKVVPRRN